MSYANNNIKAIVFDLGNVIIDFDHTRAAKKICEFSDKSADEIFDLFFDSPLTELFEKGSLSSSDFFKEVKRILNLKISFEEFVSIWNKIFFLTPKNIKLYHLARRLKEQYITCLLSNINILHYEYLKKKFFVFDAFHKIFLSYELNSRKPEHFIYEFILRSLSLKPSEVFYTDDRKELIEASKALGIISAHFSNIETLRLDLVNCGVSIN